MKRFKALLLVIALALTLVIPVSAAGRNETVPISNFPDYEGIWTNTVAKTYPYALIAGNRLYLCQTKPLAIWNSASATYKAYVDDYQVYYINDNAWKYLDSSDSQLAINQKDVQATSADLVNGETVVWEADPDFFPKAPLHQVILEVVGEQMTVTLPDLGVVVSTLVLCGVGCLALLISLPTLRKVLYRFLG